MAWSSLTRRLLMAAPALLALSFPVTGQLVPLLVGVCFTVSAVCGFSAFWCVIAESCAQSRSDDRNVQGQVR